MRVRIFSCDHRVREERVNTPLFGTIVSGEHASPDGLHLGDLDGVNIADQNTHSEMRHQFYAWHNLLDGLDHVGFEHYRRLFLLDPLPGDALHARYPDLYHLRATAQSEDTNPVFEVNRGLFSRYRHMRATLDEAETDGLAAWLGGHDIIAQMPLSRLPLNDQWASVMEVAYWPILIAAVQHSGLFRRSHSHVNYFMRSGAYCNMYVMRVDLFREYMELWTECMAFIGAYVAPGDRLLGHFAERIFSLYLSHKMNSDPLLRVRRLVHLFCPDPA